MKNLFYTILILFTGLLIINGCHTDEKKDDKDSPYMLMVKESFNNEEYEESDGEYNINNMQIIFWKKITKEFYWKTKMSGDMSNTISLLDQYKSWEKNKNK